MAHQYKVGDKVRIKERKGKPGDYPCYFSDKMSEQKGKIFTIREIKKLSSDADIEKKCKFYNEDEYYYLFEEIAYGWHSSMFELVSEDHESTTSTSFEKGDLLPICGMIGKIQHYEDSEYPSYYLYFDNIDDQEHSACCAALRKLVPNFDKIADEYGPIRHESGYFPEFSTISDLVKFTQAVNNAYSKKSITTSKTLNENEIKFQRAKTSSERGIVPAGRAICGRRRKTAIKLGYLSNTTCYC